MVQKTKTAVNRGRLGLMGGTFDPIHIGHLLAAEEARVELGLDEVLFLPSGSPPHKRYDGMATAEDRYIMTLLAVCDNPHFQVSRLETDRSGQSYTVDTLKSVKEQNPTRELFLILGLDSAIDISNWRLPLEIAARCNLVVVPRPGFDVGELEKLPSQIRERLCTLNVVTPDVSATRIRAMARQGRSLRYWTPPAVECYIVKKQIYTGSDGETR